MVTTRSGNANSNVSQIGGDDDTPSDGTGDPPPSPQEFSSLSGNFHLTQDLLVNDQTRRLFTYSRKLYNIQQACFQLIPHSPASKFTAECLLRRFGETQEEFPEIENFITEMNDLSLSTKWYDAITSQLDRTTQLVGQYVIPVASPPSTVTTGSTGGSPSDHHSILDPTVIAMKRHNFLANTIPKFSGDITEFNFFKTMFDNAAHTLDIPTVKKLACLREHLSGHPLSIVNNIGNTDADYERAYDALVREYSGKRRTAMATLKAFHDVSPVKINPSADEISRFLSQITNTRNAVINLSLSDPCDFRDFYFAYSRLPPELREEFYKKHPNPEYIPKFTDLSAFLESQSEQRRARSFTNEVQQPWNSPLTTNPIKRNLPGTQQRRQELFTRNSYSALQDNPCARGLEAPYAVMVYIHGESYEWNSGNHYDGRVLASYGHVIFITVNYRLGLLGFLRAGSGLDYPLAGGDILEALRWVKDNIGSFGGDPRRVTLLGHDTGAALASLLLISPQAKGLFTRMALISGCILSPWAVAQDPVGLRERVAVEAGCRLLPKEDLAKCLRSLPLSVVTALRAPAPRFLTGVGPWTRIEPTSVVEQAGEPFLSTKLLLGTTTTESYLDFNNQDIQYGIEEDQRNRVLRTYVRNAYIYHLNEIFSTVRNEYTDWEKPIQHPINIRDSTLEALSDAHTVAPLLRMGYLHSRRGAPTYFYHFNYQSKESDYPQRLGSVRGEDVNYILGLPLVGGLPYFPQNYTTQDIKVAETVLILFTNFAKTGDPNEPRRPEGMGHSKEKGRHRGLMWELYEPTTQLYLSLSTKPRMRSHYRGHKMAIWLNLIPQLHQPGDQDVNMRHHHFHERANHFYAGAIRAESFTRIPPTVGGSTIQPEPMECPPNITGSSDEPLGLSDLGVVDGEGDEADLLERHYYSTSTALGVTVGVGCLLLVLNALIFSAIYYQRRRRKGREQEEVEQVEIKTLSEASSSASALPTKQPPTPPMRTSSVPTVGTIKKRVQIQEISV